MKHMMKPVMAGLLAITMGVSLFSGSTAQAKDSFPDARRIPDAFGAEIHLPGYPNGPSGYEMDLMKSSGIKIARIDMTWYYVEKTKGSYDFTYYDKLINALIKRGIRPYACLAFGNKYYGETTYAVRTPDGIKGFANFAGAAAAHYRGQKVIWEIWNEPNIPNFWTPKPNVNEYMALLTPAVAAIRKADPDALIVGPALSGGGDPFLLDTMRKGILDQVDGLAVHPYLSFPTVRNPERIENFVTMLRSWLKIFKKEDFPLIFSEWGYSYATTDKVGERIQARFLARSFLLGTMHNIPGNLWYDWMNDDKGAQCTQAHKCYGMVTRKLGQRPAFMEMKRLTTALNGYTFTKRLAIGLPTDYYLLYTKPGQSDVVAAWSTVDVPHLSPKLPNGKAINMSPSPSYQKMN